MNYRPYQINSTYAKELKLPNISKTVRYVPKKAFPDYLSEEKISPSIIGCGYGIFSQEISQNLHVSQRVGEVKKSAQ